MTDLKRDARILLKFVRETGSRSPLCHPLSKARAFDPGVVESFRPTLLFYS